jgi:hypothetical protein
VSATDSATGTALRITATRVASLPRLGWVAEVNFASGEVRALHGTNVDVHDGILSETC